MGEHNHARGRLIAVDGSGPRLASAAAQVARSLGGANGRASVSAWDASGIFTEVLASDAGVPGMSARTLTLLYAADLSFRLRWQIQPALEEGRTVVVAPYVETAKALAVAADVPTDWLDEIFRIAPRADVAYHAAAGREHGLRTPASYVKCFVAAASAGPQLLDAARLRKRSAAYLAALERAGAFKRLASGTPKRAAPRRRSG